MTLSAHIQGYFFNPANPNPFFSLGAKKLFALIDLFKKKSLIQKSIK